MKYRKALLNDQEQAEKAYELLQEFFDYHPEIEGAIMAAAMSTKIAENYAKSGVPYDFYLNDMINMAESYYFLWKKNEIGNK